MNTIRFFILYTLAIVAFVLAIRYLGASEPGVRVLPQAYKKPKPKPVIIEQNGDWRTEGVELNKVADEPKILYGGRTISRAQAMKLVEGKEVPDDKNKVRVTAVGPDDKVKQVEDDLNNAPALAPYKSRVLFQGYAPDNWAVQRTGFVVGGSPTIYVQAPDGTVLHRQDDYEGGPVALAEAIRKADPNYDPSKDPDLRKSKPDPVIPVPALPDLPDLLSKVPPYAWVLLGVGFLLLVAKKENN